MKWDEKKRQERLQEVRKTIDLSKEQLVVEDIESSVTEYKTWVTGRRPQSLVYDELAWYDTQSPKDKAMDQALCKVLGWQPGQFLWMAQLDKDIYFMLMRRKCRSPNPRHAKWVKLNAAYIRFRLTA